MPQYDNLKFSGYINVKVDAVDIEQVTVEHPNLKNETAFHLACKAAVQTDSFKSIQRVLASAGYFLEPDDYLILPGGAYEIIFMAHKKQEAA